MGTDNPGLLDDPLYVGYRHPRLRGEAYDEFIEEFVEAVNEVFPHALLQWEDFKQHNAIRILDRYPPPRGELQRRHPGHRRASCSPACSAALRILDEPLRRSAIVFLGAGAAGVGIARLLRAAMEREGADRATIAARHRHARHARTHLRRPRAARPRQARVRAVAPT